MGKKKVKEPRKERDHRVGVIVDVEHPGTNRRVRRLSTNNNPARVKREARRAEEARLAAEEAAAQEALDKAEEA